MKTLFRIAVLAVGLCLAGAGTLRADEALRRVQQSLRDQGFYYGPIDGSPGDETTQAVRRYQIRNGLPVTGQLDDETRRTIEKTGGAVVPGTNDGGSLRGTGSHPAPVPPARAESSPAYQRPTVRPVPPEETSPSRPTNGGSRRDIEDEEDDNTPGPAPAAPLARPDDDSNDRPDLRAGTGAPPRVYDPSGPVPRGAVLPSARLSALFEGTPYEFAPPPVQGETLRRVQAALTRQGFYDGALNGVPSDLTTEAITNFQGVHRLRRTGRLDVATLGTLRLLPGRQSVVPRDRDDDDDDNAPRRGPNIIFEGRIVR